MKKIIYFVAIRFLISSAPQVLAYELLVLSDNKSQNSKRWKEEVFPEYGLSETGKKLSAKIITIQENRFPQWLDEDDIIRYDDNFGRC